MQIRNLLPWVNGAQTKESEVTRFTTLKQTMKRRFDDLLQNLDLSALGALRGPRSQWLRIDIVERPQDLQVTAELPGMSGTDLVLVLSEGNLTIRGEKKAAVLENTNTLHRMERFFGSVSRTIPLPCDVDGNRVEARLEEGVLTVRLPKPTTSERTPKKIDIKPM
jgi:HSP20 family protein